MYMEDVWQQPGILCAYPLATLSTSGFFFSFDVQTTSRYLRAPFTSYECAAGELNEGGFPPDFFTDEHVRRGFAYCMDYFEFLAIAFLGEAVYPATPAIYGLPYRQSEEWYTENQYTLDLAKAEEEFKLAWGGELWTTGFTLPICYNIGNLPRKTIAEMMETNVELLNEKFHVDAYEVEWGTVYIPELFNGELTMFIIGWLADYPDPHNFFHPYMHSHGAFAGWQFYSNPDVDALVEEGGTSTDAARREEIYHELQALYISECPGVQTHQAAGRHWERDWVQGWYYNPIYSGTYCYDLWKEELPRTDMNDDGAVNIQDISRCARAFGGYYLVGDVHPRWDSYADINQDTLVNIVDIAEIARGFGWVAPAWTPPS
jgi:peptide/nickel transport system substrate-binding protein